MSNTTLINSKAIQTLLAQSESRLSQTAAGPGAASGPTFHQLLEKTVSDDAHALSAATPARHLGVSLPDSPRGSKSPVASFGAAADGHSPAAPGARPATTVDPKKDGLPNALTADDSPNLDATQMKAVNAPALPEPPPAVVRQSGQPVQARGQPEGTTRGAPSAGGQTPGVAGAAGQTIGAGPRGFAAVLATAHASASTPASLVDQASLDPTLHMTVTPQAAHLSLDTGATGALTAQLQITNGVADVHLTGEAAAVLAKHGAELSLGLTAAGLQPGRLEITAPGRSSDMQSATSDKSGTGGFPGHAPRDDSQSQPEPPLPNRANPTLAAASTLSQRASHVHVKA